MSGNDRTQGHGQFQRPRDFHGTPRISATIALGLALSGSAPRAFAMRHSPGAIATEEDLRAFAADSRSFMSREPEKRVLEGPPLGDDPALAARNSPRFIRWRIADRQRRLRSARALIAQDEQPRNLVDDLKYDQLDALEAAGLMSASLAVEPWSDDYWPMYSDVIAFRYADPGFPNVTDWKQNSDYMTSTLGKMPVSIDSPAEKYDMLAGDPSWTLTRENIEMGQPYYDADGSVATWMGICNGWSPASFMAPRPLHDVQAMASNGSTLITFHPSDIKALTSELWANGEYYYRFIGGHCDTPNPPTNAAGRVLDQRCFEVNPAALHLSLTNQIGVSRRGLIIDATNDTQVWNQPVLSYSYSYFNPQTMYTAPNLQAATVPRAQFTRDRFPTFRAPQTVAVTGIIMDLIYVAETQPTPASTDSPAQDRLIQVRYYYDLEQDSAGTIIGGEWYVNRHPDFLWVPIPGAQAISAGDASLNQEGSNASWDGSSPLPSSWTAVIPASSQRSQPLARIVNQLLRMAQ